MMKIPSPSFLGSLVVILPLCFLTQTRAQFDEPGDDVFAVLSSPEWDIVLSSFGYSDVAMDSRPGFVGREYLSGEWAAAIGYTKDGTAVGPIWLEPNFLFPDWETNSDFEIIEVIDAVSDPATSDFATYRSIIANADLRITMTYEMVDTETGIAAGLMPKSDTGSGAHVLSSQFVFRQTYSVENISDATISGVQLFQFLHGVESAAGLYDDRHYDGAMEEYHHDLTLLARSYGFDGRSGAIVLHRDTLTLHARQPPSAWEIGYYGILDEEDPWNSDFDWEDPDIDWEDPDFDWSQFFRSKPEVGVHLAVEANALSGLDFFEPSEKRWVSGALRFDLGVLEAGGSKEMDTLLSIQTAQEPKHPRPVVQVTNYSFQDNEFKIAFKETTGAPVNFYLARSLTLGPGPDEDEPTFFFIEAEESPDDPGLKIFKAPVSPEYSVGFFVIELSLDLPLP